MAAGLDRCMYCGENVGTDVDHFEPLSHAPLRTYDWLNHLLACSRCNSQAKGDTFLRDPHGDPLLIDPTAEDPHEHLELRLASGRYRGLTPRGIHTIDLLRLNRSELELGRAGAFIRAVSMLRDSHVLSRRGRATEAQKVLAALHEQPFADVFHVMLRIREKPRAHIIIDDAEALTALRSLAMNR